MSNLQCQIVSPLLPLSTSPPLALSPSRSLRLPVSPRPRVLVSQRRTLPLFPYFPLVFGAWIGSWSVFRTSAKDVD